MSIEENDEKNTNEENEKNKENMENEKKEKEETISNIEIENEKENNKIILNDENIKTKIEMKSDVNLDNCFDTLNESIENLNLHVNKILKGHEEQYLIVFNAYVCDVHKEIRVLKNILKEEKIKELGNIKLKKTQKELNWYINECLRLDKISENLKKEAEKWKRNSTLMKDHIIFLENKLNKNLNKIIEYEKIIKHELNIDNIDIKYNEIKEIINKKNKKNDIKNDKKKKEEKILDEKILDEKEKEKVLDEKIKLNLQLKNMNLKIKNLEKKLKIQIDNNLDLQNKLTKHYINKTQYEKLFIECVQEIKNEIKKINKDEEKEKYIEDNFSFLLDEDNLNLSDINKNEKKKILKLFFSSNYLITFISKMLFNKQNILLNENKNVTYDMSKMNVSKKTNTSLFIL